MFRGVSFIRTLYIHPARGACPTCIMLPSQSHGSHTCPTPARRRARPSPGRGGILRGRCQSTEARFVIVLWLLS
eukprot:7028284-Prymnesium_polylepis.1